MYEVVKREHLEVIENKHTGQILETQSNFIPKSHPKTNISHS